MNIKEEDNNIEANVKMNFAGEKELIIEGKIIKYAKVKDEWYQGVQDPKKIIDDIKRKNINTDVFIFAHKPPNIQPQYNYYFEWDNIAAIHIRDYDDWFKNRIPKQSRTHIRKSQKKGVEIKIAKYDDEFVKGIKNIYDESPIRQGKPFWHYKKDLKYLNDMHKTYIERTDYIGAYYKNTLIGFLKLVYSGETARTMHIISMFEHRKKSPNNALLAKAVEVCCDKKVKYLVYGKYDYGKIGSKSLTTFKEENGFEMIKFPRYYVPINIKGNLALKFKLHKGIIRYMPEILLRKIIDIRTKYYWKKYMG